MSKSPTVRHELRMLDAALHELVCALWKEGLKGSFKKLRRIKIYAIRSFVAMHPDAGAGSTVKQNDLELQSQIRAQR